MKSNPKFLSRFLSIKIILLTVVIVSGIVGGLLPLLFASFCLWDFSFDRKDVDVMPGITVEYPTKILADDEMYHFDFILRDQKPYSLTVIIPNELSVENIFPPTALIDSRVNDRGETLLVLDGQSEFSNSIPHLSIRNTITQSIKPSREITDEIGVVTSTVANDMFLGDYSDISPIINNRISLAISSSGLFNDPLKIGECKKFKKTAIRIHRRGHQKADLIPVDIENSNRALWRQYINHYLSVFAVPFLITLIGGFLIILYEYRVEQEHNRELREAEEKRRIKMRAKYKDAMKSFYDSIRSASRLSSSLIEKNTKAILAEVSRKYNEIERLYKEASQYLEDYSAAHNKIIRIFSFVKSASAANISLEMLSEDPEVWLGALNLVIQQKGEQLIGDINFRRLVRLFPSHLLKEETDRKQYQELRDRIKLFPSNDRKNWMRFSLQIETITPARIDKLGDLQLFPPIELNWGQMSRAEQEKKWLFSAPGFFYPHPLWRDIIKSEGPIVVVGEPGSGRTALAMGLTSHASEGDVLCAYFTKMPSLEDIHRELIAQLLRFSTKRPTYLMPLHHAELNLLAELLNEGQGKAYVLVEIEKAESRFRENLRNTTEEEEKIQFADALIQLEILKIAVAKADVLGRFSDMSRAIQTIAHSLEFRQIRIGLDINSKKFPTNQQLETLLVWGQDVVADITVKAIFFIPDLDGQWNWNMQQWGAQMQELRWDKDLLQQMLLWRAEITGLPTDMFIPFYFSTRDTIEALINEAKDSPRRLAQLWRHIILHHPGATQVTEDMIRQAGAEING